MPQEKRKRGRRAEKKRVKDEPALEEPAPEVFDNSYADDGYAGGADDETTFYGLLTEQESEYFKRADELLELNQFGDEEERGLFIDNLYKEVAGKELKIVHSQGCSRLLERLILTSNEGQLKKLFQAFVGHFKGMVEHRFASHCCETLLLRCREVVTREMDPDYKPQGQAEEEVYATMESLFLYMLNVRRPGERGGGGGEMLTASTGAATVYQGTRYPPLRITYDPYAAVDSLRPTHRDIAESGAV